MEGAAPCPPHPRKWQNQLSYHFQALTFAGIVREFQNIFA